MDDEIPSEDIVFRVIVLAAVEAGAEGVKVQHVGFLSGCGKLHPLLRRGSKGWGSSWGWFVNLCLAKPQVLSVLDRTRTSL